MLKCLYGPSLQMDSRRDSVVLEKNCLRAAIREEHHEDHLKLNVTTFLGMGSTGQLSLALMIWESSFTGSISAT